MMGRRCVSIRKWRQSHLFNVGGENYRLVRKPYADIVFKAANADGAMRLSRNINRIQAGLPTERLV